MKKRNTKRELEREKYYNSSVLHSFAIVVVFFLDLCLSHDDNDD